MALTARQARGEATRQRIVAAAITAFARQGYTGTRLDDIARELGITRQAVLFHFKDKPGLYDAAIESLLAETAQLTPPQPREAFDSLHAYVSHLVHSTVAFHFHMPEFARISLQFLLNPAPLTDETSPRLAIMISHWQTALDEGREKGLTREVTLHSVLSLIGGMLAYHSLLPGGRQASSAIMASTQGFTDQEQMEEDLLHAVEGLLGLMPGT